MGGHVDACEQCGQVRILYHSCRNRHCPKCQGTSRLRWVLDRQADLLPVNYFHVVFTLPAELNVLCLFNDRLLYNTLFRCGWQTINTFGHDPNHLGAQTGMTAVLHTWGQNLSLHPHIHCIVPGGGLGNDGHWKPARCRGEYLFPVEAMSKVFRGKFLDQLKLLYQEGKLKLEGAASALRYKSGFQHFINSLYAKEWVVYAKQPFAGPEQVIEYLGNYTHRIAISNHRIREVDDEQVSFFYKDYRDEQRKVMNLDGVEFLRRFLLHVLPPGFCRIRHYGLLSSRTKTLHLHTCRKDLGVNQVPEKKKLDWKKLFKIDTGKDVDVCHCCGGRMITVMELLPQRGPPAKTNNPWDRYRLRNNDKQGVLF